MLTQDWKDALLVIASLISTISLIIAIRYRRKDIYTQLLKEQIAASYLVMNDVLELNHLINEQYKKTVSKAFKKSGEFDEKEIAILQSFVLVEIANEYQIIFNRVMSRGFIFPDHIQKIISKYFEKIGHLFENENNMDLGIKLIGLYHDSADLTDSLSHYFKVEKLSKQMNKLL